MGHVHERFDKVQVSEYENVNVCVCLEYARINNVLNIFVLRFRRRACIFVETIVVK